MITAYESFQEFAGFDLEGFQEYLMTERRMAPITVDQTMKYLLYFRRFCYDLSFLEFDLKVLRTAMMRARERYAPNTLNSLKTALNHWYRFLYRDWNPSGTRAEREMLEYAMSKQDAQVAKLMKRGPRKSRRLKDRRDLLTVENIEAMCQRCQTRKWAAAIALSWDLAIRPGELCNLDYEGVGCDARGWFIRFQRAKTGEIQTHYLLTWLAFKYFMPYYREHIGSGPLFVTRKGKRFTTHTIKSNITPYSKLLKKRVYPYLIRESASTWWRRRKLLSVEGVKHRMGHAPHSQTFEKHYQMLFDDDFADEVASAQGRSIESVEPYLQRFCETCKTVNPPLVTECFHCRAVLDKDSEDLGRVVEIDELQRENIELQKEVDDQSMQLLVADDQMLDVMTRMQEQLDRLQKRMEELGKS